MIEFPSHRAAAFCGAMAMPLAVFGHRYVTKSHPNNPFIFFCFSLIVFLPMIFSAVDFADLKEILKEIRALGIFNIFQLRYTYYEDVTRFVGQSRNRIALYCAYGILSCLFLFIISSLFGL